MNASNTTSLPLVPTFRDIFLSHRSSDNSFVWSLAADIEKSWHGERRLTTWVDEAEIRGGQSIPGAINQGLETSRFIGLVLSPAYFTSESGWTDAEWHSALHSDPDNRAGKIIPILAQDCPYIPVLLRHLRMLDFRERNYKTALDELLSILRDEPLPRPISFRGQLITPSRRVGSETLVAERAIPFADPDVVQERLYCNLLPVEHLPANVYVAPLDPDIGPRRKDSKHALPSKQQVKEVIRLTQLENGRVFMPAFRLVEGQIFTFHDLEIVDSPFADVIDSDAVETIPTQHMLIDEDDRRIVVSLLNMAIRRHAERMGLVNDDIKQGRVLFPPYNGGPNEITWIPRKTKARRTVARPYLQDGQLKFWVHLAAYLRMIFLANRLYLQINPTWVLTEDGTKVMSGPRVGRTIIKWTGPERNLRVLFHVRFWTTVLQVHPGPVIHVRAGDQMIALRTVPAFVQQSYGILGDQKDLMKQLDKEALLLSKDEDAIVDYAAERESTFESAEEWNEDEPEDFVAE